MDGNLHQQRQEDHAARAFDQLRAEVSLLRRGIEALTAERQETPDYTMTLATIDQRLHGVFEWARKVNERPGIKLSPELLAIEIERAAVEVRRADAQALAQARAAFEKATLNINALLARARSASDQRRWLMASIATSLLGGMSIGALLC